MLAGIQRHCRRATPHVSLAPLAACVVATLSFATVAFGADFYDGSHGPQPSPPYDYGARAYPPQRYLPPREDPYNRHSSIDQPPPYDDRAPVYPSQPYLSPGDGRYGERYTYQQPPYDFGHPHRRYGDYDAPPYGYQTYDQGAPAYRPYRPTPNGYDQAYRGNRYYGPDVGSMPPRPPAPIEGPPRGWNADPRDFPDNGVAEAVPPYETWPAYPPRGRH
jgi:hypothetical protein